MQADGRSDPDWLVVPDGSQLQSHTVADTRGGRRRWKQEPPESASAPRTGVEPVERSPHNGQPEQEEQSVPTGAWRVARRAAYKPSAVKSKAANPYSLLQSFAERLTSIPELDAPSTGSRVEPCGHTGLASLAEVPASISVKADPHMPDGCAQGGATVKQASSTAEVTLRDDSDQAGPRPTSDCSPNKGQCKNCTGFRHSPCRQRLPCRLSHLFRPQQVCMSTCHQNGLWLESVYGCGVSACFCGSRCTDGKPS